MKKKLVEYRYKDLYRRNSNKFWFVMAAVIVLYAFSMTEIGSDKFWYVLSIAVFFVLVGCVYVYLYNQQRKQDRIKNESDQVNE